MRQRIHPKVNHYTRFKPPIRMVLATFATLLIWAGLFACGGGGSSNTTTPSEGSSVNLKATFTDAMLEITPNLETSGVSDWSGWQGDTQFSVLYKLFNPNSGWESVFGPVQIAEEALDIIEANEALLAIDGVHEINMSEGDQTMALTMTVSTLETGIEIPYFNATDANVTKRVVIVSADASFKTMVAYDMDGEDKSMVVHSRRVDDSDGSSEYVVFHATFNETSQELDTRAAMAADKEDSFKIHFVWQGNMEAETFALSQYTNAAKNNDGSDGFWKVLGGGSIHDTMAFRAETNDAPGVDYHVVVTLDTMAAALSPDGYPVISTSIDSTANSVEKYIDTVHADCLGWLDGFPEVVDLTWNY